MESTAKKQCNILVDVLIAHGIRHFVMSPGSRNAPIIVALARRDGIERHVVVDERSAAFIALGLAQQTGEPVAVVCTSGTALLNYAPAVAEAYYQKLPLIVISADRPMEWIDQDDSQTIRQYEALAQFVKKSYDLPARCDDDTALWYANRIVNDAVSEATSCQRAPVHINVQIDEPINAVAEWTSKQRIIEVSEPSAELSAEAISRLADEAMGKNILIIAGFGRHDACLEAEINRLAEFPNVAVLTETIANIKGSRLIAAVDRTLLAMDSDKKFVPDLLITIGGALVSRMVKAFMRQNKPAAHWHVGVTGTTVDCMQALTRRILADPTVFFRQTGNRLRCGTSGYARLWADLAATGLDRHNKYINGIGWSDLKAFSIILPAIPDGCRVQLSNGTTIRYAQLFGDVLTMPTNCNRGVSGIDGSTSTAVGASLAYSGTTLLITGDMSFSYDLSGLASQYNSPRLKIIVMKNGGGGIFRFIKSTSALPELERYLEVEHDVPVKQYAEAFGFRFFDAVNEESLKTALPGFFAEAERPAILAVSTDNVASAEILKNYFCKTKK